MSSVNNGEFPLPFLDVACSPVFIALTRAHRTVLTRSHGSHALVVFLSSTRMTWPLSLGRTLTDTYRPPDWGALSVPQLPSAFRTSCGGCWNTSVLLLFSISVVNFIGNRLHRFMSPCVLNFSLIAGFDLLMFYLAFFASMFTVSLSVFLPNFVIKVITAF